MGEQFDVNFGGSIFKGKDGMKVHAHRWFTQFVTLLLKNFAILLRRPFQLLLFLCLPSCVIFTFLIELNAESISPSTAPVLYPDIPLADLGECDVYYSSSCIRLVYGPTGEMTDAIVDSFRDINNLDGEFRMCLVLYDYICAFCLIFSVMIFQSLGYFDMFTWFSW